MFITYHIEIITYTETVLLVSPEVKSGPTCMKERIVFPTFDELQMHKLFGGVARAENRITKCLRRHLEKSPIWNCQRRISDMH